MNTNALRQKHSLCKSYSETRHHATQPNYFGIAEQRYSRYQSGHADVSPLHSHQRLYQFWFIIGRFGRARGMIYRRFAPPIRSLTFSGVGHRHHQQGDARGRLRVGIQPAVRENLQSAAVSSAAVRAAALTETLQMTERFRRRYFGHLEIQLVVPDSWRDQPFASGMSHVGHKRGSRKLPRLPPSLDRHPELDPIIRRVH